MKQKKLTQKLVLKKETIVILDRSDMKELAGGAGRIPINEKSVWDCRVSINAEICID